jgi:hypothetical protein
VPWRSSHSSRSSRSPGGSVPHGAIGARRPSEGLLDTAVSLFVVAMALGTVLVVVMVSVFGRRELDGVARKRPSTPDH